MILRMRSPLLCKNQVRNRQNCRGVKKQPLRKPNAMHRVVVEAVLAVGRICAV